MKIRLFFPITAIVFLGLSPSVYAEDRIQLKTIQIKGNKELPKILYVVPWQDAKHSKDANQKIKLHNFFGELYEPITPAPPAMAFDE